MELSDLRIFLAVAETGGITRAADRLHTVQSNVSARLAALERELAAPLFRRHPRGVALTTAGEQLLPYARQVTELIEQAKATVCAEDGTPAGPLRVGSMETTAGLRLPPVLAAFAEECPRVDLSLLTGPTEALIEDVLAHRLDGAMVAGPVNHPHLVTTPLFVEELVLITAPWVVKVDDVLQSSEVVRALVFRAGCSYRDRLERILHESGISSVRVLEYGTLEGILGCVGAGLGMTLLPRGVVERHVLDGRVRAHTLDRQDADVETVFIRRDSKPSAALTRFMEQVRDAGQPPALRVVGEDRPGAHGR